MIKKLLIAFICVFAFAKAYAQGITVQPKKPDASAIYEDIKKLNFLGSVLYVAAHPDDENTAAISYFVNTLKARTAYLSLTRGDGGQNIIGPELRELLGVIRTQELLAARATDGGEQLFTRANDFGYSKHPDETLAIWDKEEVLADVVWAIRTFKPDVIVNRFNHRTPGSTHGHHTSSAMLSVEAFDLAGNPTEYATQLQYTDTWQPKRQFFNTSWWFYGSRDAFAKADKSNLVKLDIGTYYPSYGLSNTEISSLSRSQHKSQGFGNTGSRGTSDTYLELLRGTMPSNGDIFEGIDTSWNRVAGGAPIKILLEAVAQDFDFKKPAKSIPALVKAYNLIQQLEDEHWKHLKTNEIKAIISACAGLYLEAVVSTPTGTLGEKLDVTIEAINRSSQNITLEQVSLLTGSQPQVSIVQRPLVFNEKYNTELSFAVDDTTPQTSAYWLREEGSLGMYTVEDRRLVGQPQTPQENRVRFDIRIEGVVISFDKPLVHKYNDRVKGEVYVPFEVVPEASVSLGEKVQIFATPEPKKVSVTITAHKDNLNGTVALEHKQGWTVIPERYPLNIASKNGKQLLTFTVTPPQNQDADATLTPVVKIGSRSYKKELVTIDYEHIPLQSLFLPAEAKAVRLDIKKANNYIGYIQGAGDAVAKNLEQIGYQVAIIDPKKVTPELLDQFDAIMVGIRAYNVVPEMQEIQPMLLDYVEKGGTMIAQYNTSGRWGNTKIGAPYTLSLSRDRVTDEYSDVRILAPEHPVMNFPNRLSPADFDGWTQERGLYFPNSWSSEYTSILSMNDKGETAKDGSLLVARYGEGHYIYTGLSFFRELPAGVAGAYRLLANMLSVGDAPSSKLKN